MIIKRDLYLNKLIRRMGNGSIKVITGIRRCGKSFLQNVLFYSHLKENGVKDSRIIRFAFDSAVDLDRIGEDLVELDRQKRLVDYRKFMAYVDSAMNEDCQYYLLLDEVQRLQSFEVVLLGYMQKGNVDIYVTGSNSRFLSNDVITEFRGRGDRVHVLPLSFSEYYGGLGGDKSARLEEYMVFGGLPKVALAQETEEKVSYLEDQMTNTYLRDVIDRHGVRNVSALSSLMDIVASGIGGFINPSRISNTFASVKHSTVRNEEIESYIGYLKEAFILEESKRYDIKGREYISTPYKLYFEDLGLRNVRLGFRQIEYTHIMENIIFNELRYRGFKVDVGQVQIREQKTSVDENQEVVKNRVRKWLEVDFVANKGSRRYYIQSAYDIPDDEKWRQETKPFDNISDSFKKIVVVNRPVVARHSEKGYLIISLSDFLLDPNSLEL